MPIRRGSKVSRPCGFRGPRVADSWGASAGFESSVGSTSDIVSRRGRRPDHAPRVSPGRIGSDSGGGNDVRAGRRPVMALPRRSLNTVRREPTRHRVTAIPWIRGPGPSLPLWAKRSRETAAPTPDWLWLAALLPTALIGWWTFRQVQSTIRESVRNELVGVADSVTFATERFLNDKARLVESWSRQPEIRQAIAELVECAARQTVAIGQQSAGR